MITPSEKPGGDNSPMPLIHITDLYHRPQDPDDHVDLATLFALPELEPRAIILDVTRRFLCSSSDTDAARDPGFVPVAQLNYLTGRAMPVAAGPPDALRHPGDTAEDRPACEQAGIELLLHTLEVSEAPVLISVVGSARVLTAAFNRAPDLVRSKTAAVLLNAGAAGEYVEWNVFLDPAAYIGLWRSGLPIWWFPCAGPTGPFDHDAHNTYWQANQADLLEGLASPMRAWFSYAYTGNRRGDIINVLNEQDSDAEWSSVLSATRNIWSTASLIIASGRRLVRTGSGRRFMPQGGERLPVEPLTDWAMEPVKVTVQDDGVTHWTPATGAETPHRLFKRVPDALHDAAMLEALNGLLRSLCLK